RALLPREHQPVSILAGSATSVEGFQVAGRERRRPDARRRSSDRGRSAKAAQGRPVRKFQAAVAGSAVGWIERKRNPSAVARWVSLRSTQPTTPAQQFVNLNPKPLSQPPPPARACAAARRVSAHCP